MCHLCLLCPASFALHGVCEAHRCCCHHYSFSVKVLADTLLLGFELFDGGLQLHRALPSWHLASVWHIADARNYSMSLR